MAKKKKIWCGTKEWENKPPEGLQKDNECLFLKHVPSAEQYKKLSEDEKSKLDFELIASIAYLRSTKPPGCPNTYSGAVDAKCEPWLEIFTFFKLVREQYQATSTPKERAKKVEKKPVSATGTPAKQKTLTNYGKIKAAAVAAVGAVADAAETVVTTVEETAEEITDNEYVQGAMKYGSIAIAGYERSADLYNDYVDYKAAKLIQAAGHTKCKFDDDGQGGLMGTETAAKCKTSSDCRDQGLTNHICTGADEGFIGRAIEDTISFGPTGICQPGCDPPTFIDFFDKSADPKPDFFDILDSLTKQPADPAVCLNSHYENFFYIIPWQYWLMKNLESMVDSLLALAPMEINKLNERIKEHTACGVEGGLELDVETIKKYAHLPNLNNLVDELEIFPLPSIPYMEWPPAGLPSALKLLLDPLQAIRVLIYDMICYSICLVVNPIIYSVLALMNEDLKGRIENYDENSKSTQTKLPYGTNINMKKSDVNEFVSDENLREAHEFGYVVLENPNEANGKTSFSANHQHIFQLDRNGNGTALEVCHPMSNHVCHKHEIVNWTIQSGQSPCYPNCRQRYGYEGVPSHFHIIPPNAVNALVREYINVVNYEEKMTVKDLITLLAGDASCYVKGILITIGKQEKYKSLQLHTTGKILQFWKYLGNNMDIFSFIENSKLDCTPDICPTLVDEELLNQLLAEMDKVCNLMKKPEDLLPITPENIKAMALAIANKALQDAGHGDSKLDLLFKDAIIPSKTRLTSVLSKRCEKAQRLRGGVSDSFQLATEGWLDGYFTHFEGDIDEWIKKYGDSADTANKIGNGDKLRRQVAIDWCGGKRGAAAAEKKAAKEKEEESKKGSDAAKASEGKCPAGMNVGVAKSDKFKPGEQPCLFVNAEGTAWTAAEVHKHSHSSAVKYADVVESLDSWTGTDLTKLWMTIDAMSLVEKDWICQRAVFTSGKNISGPNNPKYSLLFNICDETFVDEAKLASKLGCKCK